MPELGFSNYLTDGNCGLTRRLDRRLGTQMKSLKGYVLAASPQLLDPNFARTVVLLLHHSEEGAFGVILNRVAENSVRELWEKIGEGDCANEQPVHLGGPVEGPLMALHTNVSASELEVLPGLHFSAQRENLETLLREDCHPVRVFVGHAGWSEGQLEREIQEGSWLMCPGRPEYVFDESGVDLWKTVAKHIGDRLLTQSLGIKHLPENPTVI